MKGIKCEITNVQVSFGFNVSGEASEERHGLQLLNS